MPCYLTEKFIPVKFVKTLQFVVKWWQILLFNGGKIFVENPGKYSLKKFVKTLRLCCKSNLDFWRKKSGKSSLWKIRQIHETKKILSVCHLTKIPASVIFTEEIDFVFLFDLGQARESKLKFHLGIEDVKLFCDNIHIACQQRFFQFSIFHMIIKDSFQF